MFMSVKQKRVERGNNFIKIDANGRVNISLVGYCADFEKDNPTPQERFSISSIPRNFEHVLRNIQLYREEYPNKDITVAAQTALWISQGHTLKEIRGKFDVSPSDETLANQLTQ